MDRTLKQELDRARAAAARARALIEEAQRAGGAAAEAGRRRREVDRAEDLGRSTVLECLEAGQPDLALQAAAGLAGTLEDEAGRAARARGRSRPALAEGP